MAKVWRELGLFLRQVVGFGKYRYGVPWLYRGVPVLLAATISTVGGLLCDEIVGGKAFTPDGRAFFFFSEQAATDLSLSGEACNL